MTTSIGITPDKIDAIPGEPAAVLVQVTNHLSTATQFQVRVVGSDAAWSGPPLVTPLLEPGYSTSFELSVSLPLGFPDGEHLLGVEAVPITDEGTPSTDQRLRQVVDLVVSVGSLSDLHAVLEPRNIRGRQRGRGYRALKSPQGLARSRGRGISRAKGGQATVTLRNRGWEPIHVTLTAESPGDEVSVTFSESEVVVEPGHLVPVSTKVKAPRPTFGRSRRSPFTITARGRGQPIYLEGNIERPPRIRPTMMKATAALAAIAVLAGSLALVWEQVTTETETEEATAEQAGAVDGADGDGTGAGANGDGAPGGVDFDDDANGNGNGADDQQVSSAVQASGQVEAREPQGVQVRIRSVSLVEEISENATFQAGVRGVNTSSSKLFGRRSGVIHNRIVPAQITTTTDEDGRWAASGIGGPGFYEIRFAKAGYATRAYVVELPEDGSPISLDTELEAGDGAISGIVSGPGGPLGDAEIAVTDGDVTLTTTTPTTGAIGSWSVEGLTTPGTYLITTSRRGYGTATQLVRLGGGETRTGVQVGLTPGVGTITGTVRSSAGPLGDIHVTATNGDITRHATTLTEGPVGSFAIPNLPIPDTYTLTIEGEGWMSQTRDVVLTGGEVNVGVEMVASTGIIYGKLTNTAGDPIAGAGVTAINEERTYKNTTAPDGTYEMVGLEPGSYVVEFQEFEYHPGSSLVTLGPGALREVNVTLNHRDTLEPPPNNSLTVTLSAPEVTDEIRAIVIDRESGEQAETTVSGGGAGNAVFNDVPAGVRTLDITGEGFQETSVQARVALTGNNSVGATLRPLVVTSLEVSDFEGRAISGADIEIRRVLPLCGPNSVAPGCHIPLLGQTTDEGFVRLVDENTGDFDQPVQLSDGDYQISISHPAYVDRDANFSVRYETDPTPSEAFTLNRLAMVRFHVAAPRDDDGPQLGELQLLQDYTVTLAPAFDHGDGSVRSPEAGESVLEFDGIPNGTYTATIDAPGYDPVEANLGTLTVNDIEDVHRIVFRSRTTHGTVVWEDPDEPNDPPLPIAGATVEIEGLSGYSWDGGGSEIPVEGNFDPVMTDENGQFAFPTSDGPVFGEATITINHPDFDEILIYGGPGDLDGGNTIEDVPVGSDVGDVYLAPRDGGLLISAGLDHGVGDPGDANGANMRVRFIDGPGGFDEGPYESFLDPFLGWFWTFTSPNDHGSLSPGTYVVELSYEPGPNDATFTPTTFEVFIPPNTSVSELGHSLYRQGSIEGTVSSYTDPAHELDPTFHTVLEGATVEVEFTNADGDLVQLTDETDANGGFHFDELDTGPPGDPISYEISVSKEGYTDATEMTVELGVGEDRSIDLTMRKLASVRGQVLGDRMSGSASPLDGAFISVDQGGTPFTTSTSDHDCESVFPGDPSYEDEDGCFEILGLEQGEAIITIYDTEPDFDSEGEPTNLDYQPLTIHLIEDWASHTDDDTNHYAPPLDWGEDRDLDAPPLVLPVKPATLSFEVFSTGDGQEPQDLEYDLIRVGDDDVPPHGDGFCQDLNLTPVPKDEHFSDNDGVYTYTELAPGGYVICLNAPNHAPKERGVNLEPDDEVSFVGSDALDLTATGSTVSGTVTLRVGGQPLDLDHFDYAGVLVELLDGDGNVATDPDNNDLSTMTDEDGGYTIPAQSSDFGIPDGTYDLRFTKDGYETVTVEDISFVDALEHEENAILDAFDHDVTIEVRTAVGNALLNDARVLMEPDPQFPNNTTQWSYPSSSSHVPTGVDGEVTFTDVVPGRYVVVVNDEYQPGGHQRAQQQVHVEISDDPPATVAITIAEALVTGTVAIEGADENLTLSGVRVAALDAGGEEEAFIEFSNGDDSAPFDLYVPAASVSSTDYDIVASRELGNFLDAEEQVAVTHGATVPLVTDPLVVEEAANITIRVREEATQDPIQGATISYDGPSGTGDEETNSSGEVAFSGLIKGDYTFTVDGSADGGYEGVTTDPVELDFGSNGTLSVDVPAYGSLRIDTSGGGSGNAFEVILTPEHPDDENPISLGGTGTAGSRTIHDLPTGTYQIEVCWPAFDETTGDCEPDTESVYHGTAQATVERGDLRIVQVTLTEIEPDPEPDP